LCNWEKKVTTAEGLGGMMMARLKGRRQVEVGTSEGRRRSRERKKEIRESKLVKREWEERNFMSVASFWKLFLGEWKTDVVVASGEEVGGRR
jgi:hypothetical protein